MIYWIGPSTRSSSFDIDCSLIVHLVLLIVGVADFSLIILLIDFAPVTVKLGVW